MATPPPECVSKQVIDTERESFSWYPHNAVYCGSYGGSAYYRQGPGADLPAPPPPPPPPPPAASGLLVGVAVPEVPGLTEPTPVTVEHPGDRVVPPVVELPDEDDPLNQPPGDVDGDEDPDAYVDNDGYAVFALDDDAAGAGELEGVA